MKTFGIIFALLAWQTLYVETASARPCSTIGAKDGCYGTKGPLSNYRLNKGGPGGGPHAITTSKSQGWKLTPN